MIIDYNLKHIIFEVQNLHGNCYGRKTSIFFLNIICGGSSWLLNNLRVVSYLMYKKLKLTVLVAFSSSNTNLR